MLKKLPHCIALTLLLSAWPLAAQNGQSPSGSSPSTAPHVRQAPCWEQAGVTKSVFEEHQALERETHSQVASVCQDTSLTQPQKLQRIKEIRQQTQQKTDELITPDQQKAIAACRQQRGENPGIFHGAGGNPCGSLRSRQGAYPNGSRASAGGDSSSGNSSEPHN